MAIRSYYMELELTYPQRWVYGDSASCLWFSCELSIFISTIYGHKHARSTYVENDYFWMVRKEPLYEINKQKVYIDDIYE